MATLVPAADSDAVKAAKRMLTQFADYLAPNTQARKNAAQMVLDDLLKLNGTLGAKVLSVAHRSWAIKMAFPDHRNEGTELTASCHYDPNVEPIQFKIQVGENPSEIEPGLEYDPLSCRFVSKTSTRGPDGTETRLSGAAQVIKKIWETTQSDHGDRRESYR